MALMFMIRVLQKGRKTCRFSLCRFFLRFLFLFNSLFDNLFRCSLRFGFLFKSFFGVFLGFSNLCLLFRSLFVLELLYSVFNCIFDKRVSLILHNRYGLSSLSLDLCYLRLSDLAFTLSSVEFG